MTGVWPLAVERAREMGLCFGVRRAIRLLEEAAREFGSLDSLGVSGRNRSRSKYGVKTPKVEEK